MAAGEAFTLRPSLVIPMEPDYHNTITPSESMKKEYINRSSTPVERWELNFKILTNTEMGTLKTHYKDQSGNYYPFSWNTVPSYIDSGTAKTGRWVRGSLSFAANGNNKWSAKIVFEKAN